MNKVTAKIFLFLLALLAMDMSVPLHFSVNTEFLFVGILLVALYASLTQGIIASVFFGMLKDALLIHHFPFSVFLFMGVCLATHYPFKYIERKRAFQYASALGLSFLYTLVSCLLAGACSAKFVVSFFTETAVVFLFLDYVVRLWIPGLFRG